jgi:hypothetical protein
MNAAGHMLWRDGSVMSQHVSGSGASAIGVACCRRVNTETVTDTGTVAESETELPPELPRATRMPNLTQLFAGLGIRIQGNSINFQDDAPLAKIRRSITAPLTAAR